MSLKVGETLHHRYKISKLFDKGGFSQVYLAYDRVLESKVAIKEFKTNFAPNFDEREARQRFKQESWITRKLEHPHIITIYERFEEQETLYIVMPYCPDSLEKRLKQNKYLSLDEGLRIITEIYQAVAHAHTYLETPVVHCDLKPGNILFDQIGRVQVADFGIAYVPMGFRNGSFITTAYTIGTLPYMSPEQLQNNARSDPRVDVYALGALSYQILAGCYYLEGLRDTSSPWGTAQAILDICQSVPSKEPLKKRNVPLPVIALLLKALAKEPEARYANAADMLKAFQQALEPSNNKQDIVEATASPSSSPSQQGRRWPTAYLPKYGPALLIVLGSIMLTLAFFTIFWG